MALLLLAGVAQAAPCSGDRHPFPYPIVMKGPSPARGLKVTSFVAYSRQGSIWHRVPVQVEEVNARGDYVLEGGLPFTRGTDDGWFDANDEMVVAGEDLGDDFNPTDVDPSLVKGVAGQWKVGVCRGGDRLGHLLIQSLAAPRAWSAPEAVHFDKEKTEVATGLYTYRFAKKNPVLLGEVLLKHGGKDVPAIRDSQFLMPLKTPFYLPDMTFVDDDFTSTIESWQSGPLRTIVAVGVKYTSFLSLFKLHLFSELVFYRNRFVIPTVIEFVFDPAKYLKPGSGLAYALRFPEGGAWTVQSNLAPLPRRSPADVVEHGATAAATDVFQASGHAAVGSFRVQVRVDEAAREQVPPPFLLTAKDFGAADAMAFWPWLDELTGDLGVYLDVSRIHKGTYDFGLDLLLSPKADESFTDYGSVDTNWQRLPLPRK